MALPNPAINPPDLSSSRPRLHTRAPSRSPVRPARDRDLDPLLRDLSPTKTLRAFTSGPATGKHDSAISTCLETVSHSERALGAKAAQACLDLRSWVCELDSWEWPGAFDVPQTAQNSTRMSVLSSGTAATGADGDEELWGSLPAKTVQTYESRAEEIGQQLDGIDVEEMKQYVLSAHQQAGSRRVSFDDSRSSLSAASEAGRLDDFTALITATIFQALPYLTRLHRLLQVWLLRLSILRSVPSYLNDLKQAQVDLDHGWAAIAASLTPAHAPTHADFTRKTMEDLQIVVQQRVTSLGHRLDKFLDELEGSEETVPDAWIGDFESLEVAYGEWVVQAGGKVLENELRMIREQEMMSVKRVEATSQLSADQALHEQTTSDFNNAGDRRDGETVLSLPSVEPAEDGHSSSGGQQNGLLAPIGSPSLAREDSQTLPNGERHSIRMATADFEPPLEAAVRNDSPTRSIPKHVPIVIDYHGDGQLYPTNGVTGDYTPDSTALPARAVSAPPLDHHNDLGTGSEPKSSAVKRRAAFLDANVDQSSSLAKQVKSPVRSFEHASNAFTRLFSKKGDRPENLRQSSYRSTSSKLSTGSSKEPVVQENAVSGGSRRPPLSVNGGSRMSSNEAHRNRSNSQRSIGSSRSRLTLNGSEHTNGRSAKRENLDMPGGFSSRSESMESRTLPLSPRTDEIMRLKTLHRAPSQIHRLRRLSSPIRTTQSSEHDYPVDWPLASPPETEACSLAEEKHPVPDIDPIHALFPDDEEGSGSEIMLPRAPPDSNAFDQMFVVSSFPDKAEETTHTIGSPSLEHARTRSSHSGLGPRKKSTGEPTLDADMLGTGGRQDDLSVATAGPSPTTQQGLSCGDSHQSSIIDHSRIAEEDATPGSIITDVSEGEVHDAQSVDYFHIQTSPEVVQRANSSATVRNSHPHSKSPGPSPRLPKLQIPDSNAGFMFGLGDDGPEEPVAIKRASFASIESRPRSMVKSIDVTRPRKSSNASMSPVTPHSSGPVSAIELGHSRNVSGSSGHSRNVSGSSAGYNGMVFFPSPPNIRTSFSNSPVSPVSDEHSPRMSRFAGLSKNGVGDADDVATYSPVSARSPESPAPLNAAMAKRQGTTVTNGATITPKKPRGTLKPGEDTFDRHVSEVLKRLPSAAIKFSSHPGSTTPMQRTAEPRNYAGPRPSASRMSSRASSGPGDLTLAPAETTPKKSTSESEVKLYHLTQAGRDEPIKLFVRLVGEGQRVMVRVGGGWADLAEYLHKYAEHHGSRTVSFGGLDFTAAGSTPGATGGRKVSGSAAELRAKMPVTPMAAGRDERDTDNNISTATMHPSISIDDGMLTEDEQTSNPSSQAYQRTPTTTSNISSARSTPKSASIKSTSRPSTAGSQTRPQSKQGYRLDTNLSGQTSSKRADLPEQKVKWIEGMLERAKVASAEKGKVEKAKHFGELGVAGGTRRVVFRQGKEENARS